MGIILIILTLCGQPQSYILNTGTNWIIFSNKALPFIIEKYGNEAIEQEVTLPLDYGNRDKCT